MTLGPMHLNNWRTPECATGGAELKPIGAFRNSRTQQFLDRGGT